MRRKKWDKHVRLENGKEIWVHDNGEARYIPKSNKKHELIVSIHENLANMASKYVYQEYKQNYYWHRMKEEIADAIKACGKCRKFNRKKRQKTEFISTTKSLEKVGIVSID